MPQEELAPLVPARKVKDTGPAPASVAQEAGPPWERLEDRSPDHARDAQGYLDEMLSIFGGHSHSPALPGAADEPPRDVPAGVADDADAAGAEPPCRAGPPSPSRRSPQALATCADRAAGPTDAAPTSTQRGEHGFNGEAHVPGPVEPAPDTAASALPPHALDPRTSRALLARVTRHILPEAWGIRPSIPATGEHSH